MLYAVSAKLIPDRAPEFYTRLTDGSIASQRPDGAEIVAAMKRARAAPDGTVRCTETCYCATLEPCTSAVRTVKYEAEHAGERIENIAAAFLRQGRERSLRRDERRLRRFRAAPLQDHWRSLWLVASADPEQPVVEIGQAVQLDRGAVKDAEADADDPRIAGRERDRMQHDQPPEGEDL
ncbi:MAG: hypothetical protein JOZ58_15920, partial [Acetobacteraceae bacterium]|nr:hypothetical protein [Acetobacteraceae bacterium]